jgi:formate dehydrogenase subunit gamma
MSGSTKAVRAGRGPGAGVVLDRPLAQSAVPSAASVSPSTRAAGPPAGFVAPAEPAADESNTQRAKSQPGNNAPMWRAVRESGTQPGISNSARRREGRADSALCAIPRLALHHGRRGLAPGAQQLDHSLRWGFAGHLLVGDGNLVYWTKGPFGKPVRDSGRVIERFTPFERATHWAAAISFLHPGHFRHRDGLWQVLPAAGAGWHLVWMAHLRIQNRAQPRRSCFLPWRW